MFRLKARIVGLVGLVVILISSSLYGEVIYSNDFEKKSGMVLSGMGGGEIPGWGSYKLEYLKEKGYLTVNYEGLSEDKALSGKKSYKLDLTLNEGTWCYYWHPIKPKLIIESSLYLSGYVYIENCIGYQVLFELLYTDPETGHGCRCSLSKFVERSDGWKFFQSEDIYQVLKKSCEEKGRKWDPSKAAYLLDGYFIGITGNFKRGTKVILYLDDVIVGSEKVEQQPCYSKTLAKKKDTFLGERKPYEIRRKDIISHPEGKNIIINSSFELGMKNWEVFFGRAGGVGIRNRDVEWKLDESVYYYGRRSLFIKNKASSSSGINLHTIPLDISLNKDYILSFYAKGEGGNIDVGKIGNAKTSPYYSQTIKTVYLTDDWQRYQVPIKIDSLPSSITFSLKGKGKLWIDALQLEEGSKATAYSHSPTLELGLSTDKKGSIYSLEETPEICFYLFNGKMKSTKGNLTYKIKDFYHNIVKEESFKFNLCSGEAKKITKKFDIDRKGIFWIRAILSEQGFEDKKDAEINLAIISPLKGKDENSFFGASCWGGYNEEEEFKIAESIGMKFFIPYNPFYYYCAPEGWKEEAKQGRWTVADEGYADWALELCEKYNMVPVGVIGGVPSWAMEKDKIGSWHNPPKPEYITEEVLAGWSDFVYTCVNYFKDKIKYWEIWGESVHSKENAESMIKFTKSFYEAAKKADPSCIVMGLGLESFQGGKTVRWSEEMFKLGILDYLDKLSIHPYAKGTSPEKVEFAKQLETLKDAMRKYGKEKGIWITEVGQQGTNTYYDDDFNHMKYSFQILSEEAQADYTVRANIISKAHGVERYATFLIQGGPISRPYHYGLTYNACSSPKAIIPAYNNMAALLTNTSFVKEIFLKEEVRCYLFKNKKGEYISTIWNPSETGRRIKIEIPINPKKVEIIDVMGNKVSSEEEKNKIGTYLLVGGTPIYLLGGKSLSAALSRANRAKIEGVQGTIAFFDIPDKRIKFSVNNRTLKKLFLKAEIINYPSSWQVREKKREIKLNPKEEKDIVFLLDKADFSSERKDYKVEVNLTTGEKTVLIKSEPMFSPYCASPPVIDADLKEWNSPFLLDKANFKTLDKKKLPQGDLSAKVYTGWDKDCFYFAAEVTDSKFNQPYTGRMIWAGDSIQIGFDTLNNATTVGYDNDDYEYNLGLTPEGPEVSSAHGKTEDFIEKIKITVKRKGNKLYYETAFPWVYLSPFKPEQGNSMGFNLTIMDNDNEERTKKWLELTPGITLGKNPSIFKDIVFIHH